MLCHMAELLVEGLNNPMKKWQLLTYQSGLFFVAMTIPANSVNNVEA